MSVSAVNMSNEQRTKLDNLLKHGAVELEKIKFLREALNEDIKAFSEEIDVKPKHVRRAIRLAHNANYNEHQEEFDIVQALLVATGRGEELE